MSASLATMDGVERRAGSRGLCARLMELDEITTSGVVLFYMALRTEIDPGGAMVACLREGIRIAVPRIDATTGELEAVPITSFDERQFQRDAYGVPTPIARETLRTSELDAVVVPGLAFDPRGGRLGRGAGFYDRLLIRLPDRCAVLGVCFDRQVVDAVPMEPGDQRVAVVVTDTAVHRVDDDAGTTPPAKPRIDPSDRSAGA
jgi:5-formyltetrahydrofolate cyclo-ligase